MSGNICEKTYIFENLNNDVVDTNVQNFVSNLRHGFAAERELDISGHIYINCGSFGLDLFDQANNDILLSFSPRFPDGQVVRNTFQGEVWGSEERAGGMPFGQGNNFNIKILSTHNALDIWVNGYHFTTYKHRISPRFISHLRIYGCVQVSKITYKYPSSGCE